MPPLRWQSDDPAQTWRCGRLLGGLLRAGDVVALSGALGAGKTQFVKGLAAGLDVPAEEVVSSPTFVLMREHAGRLRLYHLDAYRLHHVDELLALGWEELLDEPGAVVVLEWADRVPNAIPPTAWRIEIEHLSESSRLLTISGPDPEMLAQLADHLPGRSDRVDPAGNAEKPAADG